MLICHRIVDVDSPNKTATAVSVILGCLVESMWNILGKDLIYIFHFRENFQTKKKVSELIYKWRKSPSQVRAYYIFVIC